MLLSQLFTLFFSLPFNLITIAFVFWCLPSAVPRRYILTTILIILASSILLPQQALLTFWLPGGSSIILCIIGITIFFLDNKQYHSTMKKSYKLNRNKTKQELMKIDDIFERHKAYLERVKKMSQDLLKRDKEIGKQVTLYFVVAILATFFLTAIYWICAYHYNWEVLNLFKEDFMKKLDTLLTTLQHDKKSISTNLMDYKSYFFVAILITNVLCIFLSIAVLRLMNIRKKVISFYPPEITFFHMPDHTIIVFLVLLSLFTYALGRHPTTSSFFEWTMTLLSINALLYIVQGIATITIHLRIRLLPPRAILGLYFVLSYFSIHIFVFISFCFLLIGLLDFVFEFRKKALQPKLLTSHS